jgi:anti-sigma regulatory factor (Ser/Thr protein kinase)
LRASAGACGRISVSRAPAPPSNASLAGPARPRCCPSRTPNANARDPAAAGSRNPTIAALPSRGSIRLIGEHPHLRLRLAPTPDAPATARTAVHQWLAQTGTDHTLLDTAELLISELVTNSVRHAHHHTQPLLITARRDHATVHLAVWDSGTHGEVAPQDPDPPRGGYGLQLVATLASHWGVERDDHGTRVWLELLDTHTPR